MEKFKEQPRRINAARIVELGLLAAAGISMGSCVDNIDNNKTNALKSAFVASAGLLAAGGLKYGYIRTRELDPLSQDTEPILEEPQLSDQPMRELQAGETSHL